MPITVRCPECEKRLTVRDELVGKRVKCPSCGRLLGIAGGRAEAPRPAPSTASGDLPPASRARPRAASPARRRRWPWYVGGAIAALALVAGGAVIVFVVAGKGDGAAKSWGRESTREQQEKLEAAIRRCGDFGGTITSSSERGVVFAALNEFDKAPGDLAQRFVRAARAAARKQPNASFHILVSNDAHFGLAELRALLGKEDAAQDGTVQIARQFGTDQWAVTWYVYGWCSFGVSGDRIVALKANCADLPVEDG